MILFLLKSEVIIFPRTIYVCLMEIAAIETMSREELIAAFFIALQKKDQKNLNMSVKQTAKNVFSVAQNQERFLRESEPILPNEFQRPFHFL